MKNKESVEVSDKIMMISDEDKANIEQMACGPQWDIPDTTFHAMFEQTVECFPDRLAVICGHEKISYQELNAKANQISWYIHTHVKGSENLIGICLERSIAYIIAILGIMKSGNGYVPIDPDTLNPGHLGKIPAKRLAFMQEDSDMPLIISSGRLLGMSSQINLSCTYLDIENTENLSGYPKHNLERMLTKNNIIYGMYTSGSTGKPKLTIIEHQSVINLFYTLDKYVYAALSDTEHRVSINAPFGFDASVQGLTGLLKGYCVCVISEQERNSPNHIINYIIDKTISVFDCTPTYFGLLHDAGILDKCQGILKAVLLGGEAVGQTMWERLRKEKNIQVYNVYGPTECTVDSTIHLINKSQYAFPVIGRPIYNSRIYILDETLHPVPANTTAELYIAGLGVARGYHKRKEMNAANFIQHTIAGKEQRLYKTGDMGRYLPDGIIYYCGRQDDQIKLRSHRIELSEITNNLNMHENVKESLAVVRNEGDYTVLTVYLIVKDKQKFSAGDIADFLAMYVPRYMVPNQFVIVDHWPMTANGKIDKSKLPFYQNAEHESKIKEKPIDKIGEELGEMMKEILKIDTIRETDNFMELGGDSLRVMTLLANVLNTYNLEIDFAEFFDEPTIQMLKTKLLEKQKELNDGN